MLLKWPAVRTGRPGRSRPCPTHPQCPRVPPASVPKAPGGLPAEHRCLGLACLWPLCCPKGHLCTTHRSADSSAQGCQGPAVTSRSVTEVAEATLIAEHSCVLLPGNVVPGDALELRKGLASMAA